MSAVFKRELKAYFSTPIGYIILAAYYFFLGFYFWLVYGMGSPDVANIVLAMSGISVFAVPVITMRILSEDRRQKVDQVLLTAPVKLSGIVFGKFFAALVLYAIGFAPTVIFEIIVACYVKVNVLVFVYALLGSMLLGGSLISIGMFISSLTENSVISAIITLIVNLLVLNMSGFVSMIKVEWISAIIEKASFITAADQFSEQVFSIPNIVYFISIIAAFIFLTVRSLEKRRWA